MGRSASLRESERRGRRAPSLPHWLRRALPASLWEGPVPGPAPPQVSSHLESRPVQNRGQDGAGPRARRGRNGVSGGEGDVAFPAGDAEARELCSELNNEIGATRLGSTAKPRGRGCPAGRVQLSLHRDLEGCESFSNNKRNSHPMTGRTLGQKATQRAPDLKHKAGGRERGANSLVDYLKFRLSGE